MSRDCLIDGSRRCVDLRILRENKDSEYCGKDTGSIGHSVTTVSPGFLGGMDHLGLSDRRAHLSAYEITSLFGVLSKTIITEIRNLLEVCVIQCTSQQSYAWYNYPEHRQVLREDAGY